MNGHGYEDMTFRRARAGVTLDIITKKNIKQIMETTTTTTVVVS